MIDRNYHTHTTFCDGVSTPREIAEVAADKGFKSLGFSGHSHTHFDEDYCMKHGETVVYRRDIKLLAEEFEDRLEILCGLEFDIFSDELKSWPHSGDGTAAEKTWDYLIGSVHYIKVDDALTAAASEEQRAILERTGCRKGCGYVTVDWDPEVTKAVIDIYFGGDAYSYCEAYFDTVAEVCEVTGCDMIGHFDLITKFNEGGVMWDESDPRYVAAYNRALDRLIPYGVPFEINTGAMSRGLRSEPYPSRAILEEIKRRGGKIALSSDSHSAENVDAFLDEAARLACEVGFTSYVAMGKDGTYEVPL